MGSSRHDEPEDAALEPIDPERLQAVRGRRTGETQVGPERGALLTPEYRNVRTQQELDVVEGENVLRALVWLETHHPTSPSEIFDHDWLRALHRRMFGDVWSFAGEYRTVRLNLGVPPHLVVPELDRAFKRLGLLVGRRPDEQVAMLSHLWIVTVHPFRDGNGRLTRIVADEMAGALGLGDGYFSWGRATGRTEAEVRGTYIKAIRHGVDTNDVGPLLDFARS